MKSTLTTYRVICHECQFVSLVAAYLMDTWTRTLFCRSCQRVTEHTRKD